MLKRYASAFVLLLVATAAQAQVSRLPRGSVRCDCSDTVIIAPDGGLNMNHCGATKVLAVLDRHAERIGKLLPERVEPADLDLLARKLELQRRELVRSLIGLMSVDDIERFLPFIMNNQPPGRVPGGDPGTWAGHDNLSCHSAVFWINEGLDRISEVFTTLVNLQLEAQLYPGNPTHNCNPALPAGSPYFAHGVTRFNEVWDWLQVAADNMTASNPDLAAISSYAAWWASIYGSFAFVVAYDQPPISLDARCTEVSNAGLTLAEAGGAARKAYESADACAQAQ